MEDNLSIKSSDSVTTSGEYEIVSGFPNVDTKVLNIILSNNEGDSREIVMMEEGKEEILSSSDDNKKFPISPVLNIASNGDINELEKNLTEVIKELDVNDKEGKLGRILPGKIKDFNV